MVSVNEVASSKGSIKGADGVIQQLAGDTSYATAAASAGATAGTGISYMVLLLTLQLQVKQESLLLIVKTQH
jgi:hypothetical protein